jgi:putative spermidine/putrescine transport system substrate-binding protein
MMRRMIQVDWAEIVKVRDQWNNRWRREVITAK